MEDNLVVKGRIFDIQRFSLHDGPGIRTIVFLKGCPLRCRWCCNPEGQEYQLQEMKLNGKTKLVGKDVSVEEVMDIIERDRNYYEKSGGGVTLSGGECLAHPDFSLAILKECQNRGINTAIETTSNVDYSVIEKILPYVDTYLMDIKHMNSQKHLEYTRVENTRILENANRIAQVAKNLIIRTPVIPTFNDTVDEIRAIAHYAKSIGVKEMHILPYHRLGRDKYIGLGREYTLEEIEPPSREQMEELLKVVLQEGLRGQIGG